MSENKTAIVLGATGLVGSNLVQLLLEDKSYTQIKLFLRRTTGISNPNIKEFLVDFNKPESFKAMVTGDTVFSCLGTTIKQAGNKDAQYKVDFTYQYEFAKSASENNVPNYILISSASASSKSRIFYSRVKGELEEAVQKLNFSLIRIIRPGILNGVREEKRLGETVGIKIADFLAKVLPPFKKYRSIKGEEVAKAMINSIGKDSQKTTEIYELEQVFSLAKSSKTN